MKISKKRILALILAFVLVLPVLISCGDKANKGDGAPGATDAKTSEGGGEATEAPAEEIYVYPDMDGGGAEFKIYNPTNTWFYYTKLVHEQQTGDVLDDAIYMRNRQIEEKFKISIVEVNPPTDDMYVFNPEVRKVCKSGIDTYNAIFVPVSFNGTVGAMIAEGLFYELSGIPTIDLSGEWWNQTMLREAAIGTGSRIYYTGSSINLFTLQAVSCVYFNHEMLTNLGLTLPYGLVREGKWTLDRLQEYMKAGTNLNGADVKWDKSGAAIYGLVSYDDSATALLAGSGELFINADADGKPVLAVGGERFAAVLTKISEILNIQTGNYLWANDEASGAHYEPIFMNGRALLTIGELKAADRFREMETNFGILPIPKYDEKQAGYYSHLIHQAPVLVIPSANLNPEFTGAVLDALAYVSNKTVAPALFEVSVAQKQFRDEESIEMLEKYIKNSGSFEIGMAYGWTNDFYDAIRSKIGKGASMDITSEIEKQSEKIKTKIQKTMDLFE